MGQTFTTSTDAKLIELIEAAQSRLVVVAPALSEAVAAALVDRMSDLPDLSMTVILDADPEVYRMGYGDTKGLESIRKASAEASLRLREQPGVRIGLVISDEQTLIYAPVSRNVEAGSTSPDKPNAIMIEGAATKALAAATGSQEPDAADYEPLPMPEIGLSSLDGERVREMEEDLKRTPPQPYDLTRKLNVFVTRVQYVELEARGYQLSRRRAELPAEFVGMASDELRERVTGRISTPIDGIGPIDVKIECNGKTEKLKVDEVFLKKERQEIEKALTHVFPKRGRIILREDRSSFNAQIERFEKIIEAYQSALSEKLEEAREGFRGQFLDEFLKRWKQNPPRRYARRIDPPSDEQIQHDIIYEADTLFDKIVRMEGPKISVVYKDIAIEDLGDEEFLSALHDLMKRGGVRQEELDRLFEKGEAVKAQGSFEGL